MKTGYVKFLESAIETANSRNTEYGNAYKHHGGVMAELYRNGLTLKSAEDFNRFCIINAIVGKLTRYCNSEKGHVDSAHDMINFAAMLEELTDEIS